MKVLLKDILDAEQAIEQLRSEKPDSVRLTYRLSKITRKLGYEVRDFNDARNELIRQHGKLISGQYRIDQKDNDAIKRFDDAVSELVQEEVELDIPLIELDLLEQGGIRPNVGVMEKLWFIFAE